MKRLVLILLCSTFISTIFYSCASVNSVAKKITVESGEIPPDMTGSDFILIGILSGRKSFDKYVEREFDKYTGKYMLASKSELTEKYNDTEKYRYIIDYQQNHSTHVDLIPSRATMGTPNPTYSTTGFRYFILDRKENKEYIRKGQSSFYAKEIRAYLQAIETVRNK